jgi:hypothetical protein
MWGTRYWSVKATTSHRYHVRKVGHLTDSGPNCVPQPGSAGFDVDITRRIYRSGTLIRTEKYTTHYNVEDVVTCRG